MKKLYIGLTLGALLTTGSIGSNAFGQTLTSISTARAQATNTAVTVKGIVTNGSELGSIRYLQDGTGGIAAYGTNLANVKLGDSILVTGTLTNYNQLLELSPVTTVTVINSNNTLPAPKVITISQISSTYQGQLIQINNTTFKKAGTTITKNTWTFQVGTDTSVTSVIYASSTSVIGQVLPTGTCSVVGILSRYMLRSNYRVPNFTTNYARFS